MRSRSALTTLFRSQFLILCTCLSHISLSKCLLLIIKCSTWVLTYNYEPKWSSRVFWSNSFELKYSKWKKCVLSRYIKMRKWLQSKSYYKCNSMHMLRVTNILEQPTNILDLLPHYSLVSSEITWLTCYLKTVWCQFKDSCVIF